MTVLMQLAPQVATYRVWPRRRTTARAWSVRSNLLAFFDGRSRWYLPHAL